MYWIGGNDLATKNRWVWASNVYRIYPYVNWKPADSTTEEQGAIFVLFSFFFFFMHNFFVSKVIKETLTTVFLIMMRI